MSAELIDVRAGRDPVSASRWRLVERLTGMRGQRRVSVRVERRSVALDAASGGPDMASCLGITVIRHCAGCPDDERWLPLGEEPSEADDEALIALLRDALRWSRGGNP